MEHRGFLSRVPIMFDLAELPITDESRMCPGICWCSCYNLAQHRPSLITPPILKVPAHSDPVKRWNFWKADWKRLCLLTDESVERWPPPDAIDIEKAHQEFFKSLLSAAKQYFPRGRRKNYVPCWDKECETLHRSFIRDPAATDSYRNA